MTPYPKPAAVDASPVSWCQHLLFSPNDLDLKVPLRYAVNNLVVLADVCILCLPSSMGFRYDITANMNKKSLLNSMWKIRVVQIQLHWTLITH